MTSQGRDLICIRCKWINTPDARYCAHCGEPVAPQLIAELQRIFATLTELDERIAAGQGNMSIQTLRDSLRERYLAERSAPPTAGVAAPATTPLPQPAVPAAAAATATVAPIAPIAPMTPPAMAAPAAHGPVFSWRAFIAEQAIAVMAYLGGFLLLIATLTFEVGGWQALPDLAKLAGVLGVYLIFGLLGITLRRTASLRTVSRVYLGVFALMTPLAALAVYRFELQARGFPIAGMICLAAAYAAVVYLALALRTRFVTYAYLGWAALLLSALAIPQWAQISNYWWVAVTNLVALLLLAPRALRRANVARTWLDAVEPSATQISAGAAIISGLLTALFTLSSVGGQSLGTAPSDQYAPIAAAACALIPLAAAWSWAARTFTQLADQEIVAALDWVTAASFALAAAAVATWLRASPSAFTYTITGVALAEGLAAEALRGRIRAGLRLGVQLLAIALAGYAAMLGIGVIGMGPSSVQATYLPMLAACVVGVALALLFALRGSLAGVVPWGLAGGLFLLIGVQIAFLATLPNAALYSKSDLPPDAFTQIPTLNALLTLALVALALGLAAAPTGSRLRRLRGPVEITALGGAIISANYLLGHTRFYSALLLGIFALAVLLVARFERRPIAAGVFEAIFGAIAIVVYISGNLDGLAVAATPLALALAAVALRKALGHAYAIPVFAVSLFATVTAFSQLSNNPAESTAAFSFLSLGLAAWMALAVALPLTLYALMSREQGWMGAPAFVALLSISDARTVWACAALTLALVVVGALLRQLRGRYWEIAWYGAAFAGSGLTVLMATQDAQYPDEFTVGAGLLFVAVAYAIALHERRAWLTPIAIPYALVALIFAGNLSGENVPMIVSLAIGLAFVGLGMAARLLLGRAWAPALYAIAIFGALATATRVAPYPERAGLLEAILLVFAALAFFAAMLEETPWAALAPAAFAALAALVQPDGRALLPLALGLAATAFAISRTRGAAWSLPLYGSAMVAALASVWQGRSQDAGFEVLALVTLALAAWALAALESRPDALLAAFSFAVLAVSAAGTAYGWEAWQATLAFAGLAWLIEASRLGWAALPWLHERGVAWLAGLGRTAEAQAAWRDPRRAGQRISRGAAMLVGLGAVVGGWLAPASFATQSAQTQALAVTLLSLALLLTRIGWGASGWRPALYLAGEALALAISVELRWFGADNPQAWIIAPGSAQIIIGALLPADHRIRPPAWLAQALSVAGALILTLPTLGQSITEPSDWQWRYALLLAVEALALTLLAVGLRNRILALTGSAFVGVAAVRGAIIAVQQNLPVPIVIGVFALLLMGLATWLSLRARRISHTPSP